MKQIITLPVFALLTACAQTPEPITDYNAPYLGGKGDTAPRTSPRLTPRPPVEQNVCPEKSPRAGNPVKPGHEDALCYGDPSSPAPKEPEKPEPPSECTDAGQWIEGVRYARNETACA